MQRKVGFEFETGGVKTRRSGWISYYDHPKASVLYAGTGYSITTDEGKGQSQLEVILDAIDEDDDNEVRRMFATTLPDLKVKLDAIVESGAGWTRTWNIFGVWGSPWDWIQTSTDSVDSLLTSPQMTAGVSMADLSGVVSGSRHTRQANRWPRLIDYGIDDRPTLLQSLYRILSEGVATVLGEKLQSDDVNMLASVLALMAEIPANALAGRLEYPKAAATPLLARTNFATIFSLLPGKTRSELDADLVLDLVVRAINKAMRDEHNYKPIDEDEPIFRANNFTNDRIPDLSSFTIGDWVRGLFPGIHRTPVDRLTERSFPDRAGAPWLESLGAFGTKVDPGRAPIFEFRSFNQTSMSNLPAIVLQGIEYIRGDRLPKGLRNLSAGVIQDWL